MAAVSNRIRLAGTCFILFCISLFLISYSARNPKAAGMGAAVFSDLVGPVQLLSHSAYGGIYGIWDSYINLIGVRQQARELAGRIGQLEVENSRLLEIQKENERLTEILNIKREAGLQGIAAEVIGYDPSNWVKAISINRGALDGVRVGMPVVEGNGAVGQVVVAGRHVSRVLLIIDQGSGVDVIVQDTRTRGLVSGADYDRCEMRFVQRDEQIQVGDRVITSGMDGVFPKGLVVGTVSEVEKRGSALFRPVWVKPRVDFAQLESVLVITNFAREEVAK